eukprot:PhM_4_TR16614/c0_g1_i1/m.40566
MCLIFIVCLLLLAIVGARVVRSEGRAFLAHMSVRCLRVDAVEVQRVAASELAQVVLWVLRFAHVRTERADVLRVEHVEVVIVEVRLLRTVEVKVSEHTAGLPHVADKYTAHLRFTHGGSTETRRVVVPRVLLDNGVELARVHALLCRKSVNGSSRELRCAHPFVPCLAENDACRGSNLLEVREHNLNKIPREAALTEVRGHAGVVVLDGVDPPVDEVAVAVVETAHGLEKLPRSRRVELGTQVGAERHDNGVVAGGVGEADPLRVLGALDAVDGPVGGVHRRLTEEERAVGSTHGNDCVSGRGAHCPGQHRVKTVEANDANEVAGLNVISGQRVGAAVADLHHGLDASVVLEEVQVVVDVGGVHATR